MLLAKILKEKIEMSLPDIGKYNKLNYWRVIIVNERR